MFILDGYEEQDKQFSSFLDYVREDLLNEGGDFVLLGDIFDFWRKDFVEILNTYEDIIEKLIGFPNNVEVHYVIGSHDYYISEMPEYFDQNPLITRIPDLYLRNITSKGHCIAMR
jgi:UDP-2,3-diacylglucosamine pyrophosphatase LpxH